MNGTAFALPRPLARLGAVLVAALTALAASIALAGSASAHVSVASDDAAAGGFGVLTFRVPDESDTASTVALRIQIPEESALASLRVQPIPGWTATLTSSQLSRPLESDGEQVTSYVSVVEFRADAGGGIAPGQFQQFSLSGGPFPDADSLTFPVVQTYSDGTETAWIEPTVEGQDEPEHPAPVLRLTASDDAPAAAGGDAAQADDGDDGGSDVSGVALVLAIVALLTGIAGVVLGYRAGRRTVSS